MAERQRRLSKALQIDGWMSRSEIGWLARAARSRHVIIEIGSWKGRSAMAMALATSGSLFLVDHFSGADDGSGDEYRELDELEGSRKIRDALIANLQDPIHQGKVFLLELPSDQASTLLRVVLKYRGADMIFIDGDHSYSGVKSDILNYAPLLAPKGLLCGHDSDWPGVRQALDELVPGWRMGPDSIWFRK